VRAGSRHAEQIDTPDVEAVRFDWHDESTWMPALEDMDGVYLVKPESEDVAEVVGRFMVQMASSGVNRLVLLSECAADTRAEDLPERRVELLVQASELNWTILRPNWMMQDLVDEGFFGADVRDRRVIAMTTGGQAMAWIDPTTSARLRQRR
jgi:Predicted nucleoside-diphosphate-sugar epimerases